MSTDQYSRAIKLIANKLEKTKERIQEKFYEVEDRLGEMDRVLEGVQVKINQDNSEYSRKSDLTTLGDKISLMENTINSLQKEIIELKTELAKQKSSAGKVTPEKIASAFGSIKPSPPPPGAKPATLKKPQISSGELPKPNKTPPPKAQKTVIPKAPTLPTSALKTASISQKNKEQIKKVLPADVGNINMPNAPVKKKRKLSLNDDAGDKDSLLEALKSIDNLVMDEE